MTLVFNASPLIVLAKAGLLERFLPLGDQVWILFVSQQHLDAVRLQAGE